MKKFILAATLISTTAFAGQSVGSYGGTVGSDVPMTVFCQKDGGAIQVVTLEHSSSYERAEFEDVTVFGNRGDDYLSLMSPLIYNKDKKQYEDQVLVEGKAYVSLNRGGVQSHDSSISCALSRKDLR